MRDTCCDIKYRSRSSCFICYSFSVSYSLNIIEMDEVDSNNKKVAFAFLASDIGNYHSMWSIGKEGG